MNSTEKARKINQVANIPKPSPKEKTDREKFERARKALYEYWKLA